MKKEIIVWKFEWGDRFWFVIPKDRDYYGWDFYVKAVNYNWVKTWDKVEAVEIKWKWKKPEVKITKIYWVTPPTENKVKYVEWVFSQWDWNFWFVDIEGQEKWYFVHGKNSQWARDGDSVKIELRDFKWKTEWIVVKRVETEAETYEWRFKDSDKFWFVIVDELENDVFIPWMRKNWAADWDRVVVRILNKTWKNPEWTIDSVL